MSAYDDFNRRKAVQLSAELLRDAGVAFFPIDIHHLLSAFNHQIYTFPYSALEKSSEQISGTNRVDPRALSKDGFCTRIRDVLIDFGTQSTTGNIWNIYYNDKSIESRKRFTLLHELGHVLLGHHQLLNTDTIMGTENDPEYRAADAQADQFSINALAPAPAVLRLLKNHGFSFSARSEVPWKLRNRNALFLRNLGKVPDPEQLIMAAFGLSNAAAHRRLQELKYELDIWSDIDPELYAEIEKIGHRSGWYCWVCHTRRRTTSAYCPGCGKGWDYEYRDFGKFSRPVIGLRKTGQFDFCAVCGNTAFTKTALSCPVCGNPVVNECENAHHTDGDFIRSGMKVVRGTHRCRPTDIYCPTCGVLTTFGAQHGPSKNMWLPGNKSARCRIKGTSYPATLPTVKGKLQSCPACGSTQTIREGRYCADCRQPLENSCSPVAGQSHSCDPNDRFCQVCGQPTLFFQAGFLPDYKETDTYSRLCSAEKSAGITQIGRLVINTDGTTYPLDQEDF